MASDLKWDDLSKKQRRMALKKWHQRKDAADDEATDRLDEEVAPGLTRRDLIANTKAATTLRYGDAQRQLAHQPARINNWFAQYQQAIQGAKAAQAQTNAAAVQGVQNLQQGLDAAAAQQWAGQQQAMAADAAKRGASTDPGLADVAHNASNVRNALTGSYGALLATQGANEGAYLNKRQLNAQVGRVDALKLNAQQRQALAKERGAFKQTYRDQAISDAASTALKNALTMSQLGATAASTAKTKAEAREQRLYNAYFEKYGKKPGTALSPLEAYRLAYAKKHGYFPRTGPKPDSDKGSKEGSKDEYGNTPLQQKTRTSDYRKILRDAKTSYAQAVQAGKIAPGAMTAAQKTRWLYDFLAPDYASVNIDIIRGAVQKAVTGRVGPKVARQLDELGVSY